MKRSLSAWFWAVPAAVIAGAVQWSCRYGTNPDGVSYLEAASQLADGHWQASLSTYWSPLFSWLLALLMRTCSPERLSLIPAAHALQAVLAAAAATAAARTFGRPSGPDGAGALGPAMMAGTALWCALFVVPAKYLTPDVLVLLLVILVVARMETEWHRPLGAGHRLATGLLAGLAFLAKSYVMLYFAALMVLYCAFSSASVRAKIAAVVRYGAGFFIIAAAWTAVLSFSKGRLTFIEQGGINFAGHSLMGIVEDLTPRLGPHVRHFELAFPVAMPEHYDFLSNARISGYRVLPHLLLRLPALNLSALFFGYFPRDYALFWPLGMLATLWAAVYSGIRQSRASGLGAFGFLTAASAAGAGLFLITHVESRYVAPFVVLLAAAILRGYASMAREVRRPAAAALIGWTVVVWSFPIFFLLNGMRSSQHGTDGRREGLESAARWMGERGGRWATVGPSLYYGAAAWVSKSELVAGVDEPGLEADACAGTEQALRRARVVGVLADRPYPSCGSWQTAGPAGGYVWELG